MLAYKAVQIVEDGVYTTPFAKTYGQTCEWIEGSTIKMATPCCFLPTIELVNDWLSQSANYGYDCIIKCELIETSTTYGFNNGPAVDNVLLSSKFKILGAVD